MKVFCVSEVQYKPHSTLLKYEEERDGGGLYCQIVSRLKPTLPFDKGRMHMKNLDWY
jgi:hypothetical protein